MLIYFRRPGDCALITVLFRPAFRETVVGEEPYFEIVGLRQSSHQKIRRFRFRIMPACAYRSTTVRVRLLLPKPRPPLSAEGASKKKSARNRPEPPDGENLPAPGLLQFPSTAKQKRRQSYKLFLWPCIAGQGSWNSGICVLRDDRRFCVRLYPWVLPSVRPPHSRFSGG